MQIIGHRGCRDHYPENTITAVCAAATRVDMIEIDVQRCGSGEIVVFHDDDLGRLTDTSGSIAETAYDELSELTVGDSTERIPTLTKLVETLPDGIGLNIELKHGGMAEEVVALTEVVTGPVLISSFDTAAIGELGAVDVQTAYLCMDASENAVEQAIELNCTAVHPYYETIDEQLVETAHNRGLNVNAWTVRSESEARRLQQAGVDGIIVDSWNIVPEQAD
jgi:glycerophosphoryl diester phosphodiesterase